MSFVFLVTFIYILGLHFQWDNADLDRGMLQGSDMVKGNLLLDHWYSASDSYWTIDSVFFAVGILIIGFKVVLLHIVSALVLTAVILSGIFIAGNGLRRWSKLASAATVLIVLGLPCPLLASFLLPSTIHVATALYALVAFIGLRKGRFGWGWFVAVVFFAAGILGDPLIVAYGIIPALLAGIFDGIRWRNWKIGVATWSAPLVALVVAALSRLIAVHIGTYQIGGGPSPLPLGSLLPNLRLLFENSIALLGVGSSLTTSGVPWELEIFRLVGVLEVTSGIFVGVAILLLGVLSGEPRVEVQGMVGRSDASFRMNDLLVLGVFGDAAAYVFLSTDAAGLRYLTAGIVFASVLGAMLIGQLANQVRLRRRKQTVALIGLAVVGICASCVGIIMSQPTSVSPYWQLGRFLAEHHLYRGVGDYWSSAPITVFSDGVVKVRQVEPSPYGAIEPYLWISNSGWYTGKFQFLIYNVDSSSGSSIREASQFPFAATAHIYTEQQFCIVVWDKSESMRNLENGLHETT